jgi:hypothetical protein
MNHFLTNFLAEVPNYNPALPKLNDDEASNSFTWVIICLFIGLVLLVTFKTSNRHNTD